MHGRQFSPVLGLRGHDHRRPLRLYRQHLPLAHGRGRVPHHGAHAPASSARSPSIRPAPIDGHAGEPPSPAAVEAAARRGYDISEPALAPGQQRRTSRRFDYVLAMDRSHIADLRWLAPRDTGGAAADVHKFAPCPASSTSRTLWRHAAGLRARARSDRGRLQGPAGSADTGGEGGHRQLIGVA